MSREQIVSLLRVIRAVWPKFVINDDTITAFQWGLEDMTYEAAQDAVREWIRTGKFAPTPSELRGIVSNNVVGDDTVAEAAWLEVVEQINRCGFNRPPVWYNGEPHDPPKPEWSSPLIETAVKSVGWKQLCTGDMDGDNGTRLQFIFTFRNLRKHAVSQLQRGSTTPIDPALPAGVQRIGNVKAIAKP